MKFKHAKPEVWFRVSGYVTDEESVCMTEWLVLTSLDHGVTTYPCSLISTFVVRCLDSIITVLATVNKKVKTQANLCS